MPQKPRAPRADRKKASDTRIAYRPNAADFKYIGVAIDQTIETLRKIRVNALSKSEIDSKIEELQKIKLAANSLCPQDWFAPFELVPLDVDPYDE